MDTLGRYQIIGEVGRGGAGIVYKALDPSLGRTVAIKTILSDAQADSTLRERFRREARAAGMLSHPNIVTIHEFNDSGETMFIAMECMGGRTLEHLMEGGKQLPVTFVVASMRAGASALDYAHSRQLVHRDVKPANLMLTETGEVKVTDFGIVKMSGEPTNLTSPGMLVGTAQYMSPEQISGLPATAKSDQFSLAVIAYEMLAGAKPFGGNSWASVLHQIVASEPKPLSGFRPELKNAVMNVLMKALAKRPEDRYETCTRFAEELSVALEVSLPQIGAIAGDKISAEHMAHRPQAIVELAPKSSYRLATLKPENTKTNTVWGPIAAGAALALVLASIALWFALR